MEPRQQSKSDQPLEKTRVSSASPETINDRLESRQAQDKPHSNPDSQTEFGYPQGTKLYLTLFSLCFVVILGGLDFSIVGVAVPAMTQEFKTISDVAWYTVSFRLTACACQFSWGKLFDMFPLRRVFVAASLIFMLGSAIAASAVSSPVFIIGRAITGVGSAGTLTGTFAAIGEISPLRMRPIYTSLLSGLEAAAVIVAPIVGGVFTQHISWRWCFYINLPISGVILIFLSLYLSDTRSAGVEDLAGKEVIRKLDLLGAISVVASLTCLFMALSWAGSIYAWSSYQIIILLVLFTLCLLVFCYDQFIMGNAAALPPRLFTQRSVVAAALFSFCINGAAGVLQYWLPIYFQVVRDYSPASSGYMMLPILIGFNVTLIFQGFMTTYFGYYNPFMIVSSILTAIGSGLVTTWTTETDMVRLIVYQAIFGCGAGLAFEIPQIAVQTVLPESDLNLGVSVTLFAQNFGGALFISIAQQVFSSQILRNLKGKVQGLSPEMVQNLGLVDISQSALGSASEDVIAGLEISFIRTWYIAVALACLTMVGSLMMEWRSVKDHRTREEVAQATLA